MAEEREPFQEFAARRTTNGGWLVVDRAGEPYCQGREYAFTSARDMLDALPGLVGAESFTEYLKRTLEIAAKKPTTFQTDAVIVDDPR